MSDDNVVIEEELQSAGDQNHSESAPAMPESTSTCELNTADAAAITPDSSGEALPDASLDTSEKTPAGPSEEPSATGPVEVFEGKPIIESESEAPLEAASIVEQPTMVEDAGTDAVDATSVQTQDGAEGQTASGETAPETPSEEKDRIVFADFPLSHPVQLAVQQSGYLEPTDVQRQIMPHILEGRDVLAQSQTGTGKTAAFALPLLSKLQGKARLPKVLVLAPTRELATQVANSFSTYGANIPKLKLVALYGGADYESQLRALKRGVQVVVGTPGRVIDHIKRGSLKLDDVKSVVLDEADEMLNLGFIEDVEWILEQTPESKQTALFSATMPEPIRRVADQHLSDPEVITIRRKTLTADTIDQRCLFVDERNKRELLARLLEVEETDGVIVFTKTKDSTVNVADYLIGLGLRAAALNGDLPQARRQKTVDQLKAGRLNILVATDVAARGLDVQRISHVFNFDLPHDSESYVHRIGRTGRAGRQGVAYIFLTPRQRGKLRLIEKVTKQRIEVLDPPSKDEINAVRIERFKKQVVEVTKHPSIPLYKKILADIVQESDGQLDDIAAALAHLSRGGRPLLVEDLPPLRDSRRERDSQRERGGRPERGAGPRGERRPRRTLGRPDRGMMRYWVGVGHTDGMRPGNLVGAIANEVGIPGSEIGSIDIQETYSTVDLPKGLPADVVEVLQRTWVSGKQLRLRPFTERSDDRGPRKPGKFGGKPKGNFGGKPKGKFSKGKPGKFSSSKGFKGEGDRDTPRFGSKSKAKGKSFAGGKPGGKSKPVGGKKKSKKRD
ncbi:MAG: DEAD/DEAH box helicase [Planctomycetota bacterium]